MIRPLAVLVVATAPAWSADFAERWPQPIAVDPAAVIVPVQDAEPRERPNRERTSPDRSHADICTRHRMHKVITRGGKSWRCMR